MNLDFAFLNWGVVSNFILKGLAFSVQLTLIALVGGVVLGTVLALMRLSGKPWLVVPAAAYVNTMRSIPLVMVILWFFLLDPAAGGQVAGLGVLGHRDLHAVRGGLLQRDHARRHPERAAGPGACRLRRGHDLRADHAASSCCRRPSATCCRCC
jgi:His/Glu/Gln/Arg/opine family amino acid ABC transporter permease subunit